jgi:hypothetical protein
VTRTRHARGSIAASAFSSRGIGDAMAGELPSKVSRAPTRISDEIAFDLAAVHVDIQKVTKHVGNVLG